MSRTQRSRDEGTAYEMRESAFKADLVQVGRGTPMGELLRRTGIRLDFPAMPMVCHERFELSARI